MERTIAQIPPIISQNIEVEETPEIEDDDPPEDLSPEEAQQLDEEADAQLPKPEQNPFNKPSIDAILEREFNDDMWRLLRGGLPCLETSAACLQQLQDRAVAQSPLLREIDNRVAEANEKINEARARNQKSIRLALLTPALQYLLGPAPQPGQPQQRGYGLIDNILGIIRGDTGLINGLLRVVGIPFFEGTQGGNADAQRNAIAISDIQVKVAELQRGRAKLADEIREKVTLSLVRFDEARTDFQTSQVVASRAIDQFKVFEIRYVRGNSDTETYLTRQNQLDNTKAQTYRAWAKMRRALFEIKLLVLNIKDAEI
ncbi:MAG: TolC family protein [Nostoc sp. LLA-1]|nr:TolC family protein [Cyanocohniella sp. LLY]